MCAFNALNGVPACRNRYLLTDILKGEWGFDGFVESDWTAVTELGCPPRTSRLRRVRPRRCGGRARGSALALNAEVDSEMTSTVIRDFGEELLAKGEISMSRINDAVRGILRVKMRAGSSIRTRPIRQTRPRHRCCYRTQLQPRVARRRARWCC